MKRQEEELQHTLFGLVNEIEGMFGIEEEALIDLIGVTNFKVLMRKVEAAKKLLDATAMPEMAQLRSWLTEKLGRIEWNVGYYGGLGCSEAEDKSAMLKEQVVTILDHIREEHGYGEEP